MRRSTFGDFLKSRGPSVLRKSPLDRPGLARFVNAAQSRLLHAKEARDEGWYGGWAEMVFVVDPQNNPPYVTLPRNGARLEAAAICGRPIAVQNQFAEYQLFGSGRLPKSLPWKNCWRPPAAYARNNACTWIDLNTSTGPQYLQAVAVNPADANGPLRVLFQGEDTTGSPIYSQDGNSRVTGEFVTLTTPFAQTTHQFTRLTGILKDQTSGPIEIFQFDATWGTMIKLLTMEPSETSASYRRYYIDRDLCRTACCTNVAFPPICGCGDPVPAKLVTALVKLDLVPVIADTDYLLIQNIEALIEECRSIYRSECDDAQAQQDSASHHAEAISLMIGELSHYEGVNNPSVNFVPFGSAKLERLKLTMT